MLATRGSREVFWISWKLQNHPLSCFYTIQKLKMLSPPLQPPNGSSPSTQHNGLLRAGTIDALIVLATQSYKNDFLYQEAFLCTYRTFISTNDLLEKLVHRFRRFSSSSKKKTFLKVVPPPQAIDASDDEGTAAALQLQYQRVARSSFSLLVCNRIILSGP